MNHDPAAELDVLRHVSAGWKFVAVASLVGMVGGFAYGRVAPKWYTAEVVILPSPAARPGAGSTLPGAVAALGLADTGIDMASSGVDRLAAILHSTSVTDAVIAKFGLNESYHQRFLEDTRDQLWSHCEALAERKGNLLSLTCEDRSPSVAMSMVTFFVETANQVSQRVSVSSARDERRFLESRVEQTRKDLDTASRALREFQENNRVVSLPEQAKAVVGSIASLRAKLLETQMQLAYQSSYSSREESTAEQLQSQMGILQAKIKTLESDDPLSKQPQTSASSSPNTNSGVSKHSGAFFPPATQIPMLQYQLEGLYREQKIQENLLIALVQRFETARINEVRDTSTFQVLDQPTLPMRKTRPRAAFAAIIGLCLFFGLSLIVTLVRGRRRDLVEARSAI